MRRVPPPAYSERRNAFVDHRTKEHLVSTYLMLKHSHATKESARQLLEAMRTRRLRLPDFEDAGGGPSAAGDGDGRGTDAGRTAG